MGFTLVTAKIKIAYPGVEIEAPSKVSVSLLDVGPATSVILWEVLSRLFAVNSVPKGGVPIAC